MEFKKYVFMNADINTYPSRKEVIEAAAARLAVEPGEEFIVFESVAIVRNVAQVTPIDEVQPEEYRSEKSE